MGLDDVELMMALEDALEIEFEDDELVRLLRTGTLGDLHLALCQWVDVEEQAVWQALQTVVCEQLDVPASRVSRSSRLVADLGLG